MAIYRDRRRGDDRWRLVVWANGKRRDTTFTGDEAGAKAREIEIAAELSRPEPPPGPAAYVQPYVYRRKVNMCASLTNAWRDDIAKTLAVHGEAIDTEPRKPIRTAFVPREGKTSWLYAIQAGGPTEPIKFGRAYNPLWRFQQLQTGCPTPHYLIGICSEGEVEAVIHEGLRRFWLRGEWYRAAPAVAEVAFRIHLRGEAEGAYVACGLKTPQHEALRWADPDHLDDDKEEAA